MKIVVFIKQVPDTNDVKWTENNNIDRTRMESILNPADKQALEASLKLKDFYNSEIIAVTMGPKSAINVLKEAISMGCDEAYLLCDSKFAGSDTCATSKVLAAFIKEKYPDTDIIMFGQHAIDGETSQTGPSTAARLNIPFITQVNNIFKIDNNIIEVTSDTENESILYKGKLPIVLCINNLAETPRLPKITGYINAHNYKYNIMNHNDLNLKEDEIGIKGSPTWVSKVFKIQEGRKCNFLNINSNDIPKCINTVIDTIKEVKNNK